MKAIIMAGGRGTRLLPVCKAAPKPMTELLGRPLLEHIVELLRQNGVTELCLTLGHQFQCITDYFGNGEKFGVSMEYRVEDEPLGTAGGLRSCRDFIGQEDFLLISGDCACDFELWRLINAHKQGNAALTMALFSHASPLEYGTVLTDKNGVIFNFIEKPSWDRVVTDLVNTGIYVISPRILKLIPAAGAFDLARDLFPLLMAGNETLLGLPMDGYWCDIGNPKSFLQCSMDALEGRLRLSPELYSQEQSENPLLKIHPSAKIHEGAELIAPCFIGQGAVISKETVIAHSVIGAGSQIGAFSRVTSSVIDGAKIGEACVVDGTVLCRGSRLFPLTVTGQGEVIAADFYKRPPEEATAHLPKIAPPGLIETLPCKSRAGLMRRLSMATAEFGADFSQGISLTQNGITLRISPLLDSSEISISASGGDESSRLALCQRYLDLAKNFGC